MSSYSLREDNIKNPNKIVSYIFKSKNSLKFNRPLYLYLLYIHMEKLTVNTLSIVEQAVKLSNNHSSLDSLGLRDIGNELSSLATFE